MPLISRSSTMTLMIFIVLLAFLFLYFTRKFSYWKQRNIPYAKPVLFFGNLLNVFLLKCNIGEQLATIYRNSKEPLVGIYMLHKPALLIRDPDLIKTFLTKNFDNFRDRPGADSIDVDKDPAAAANLLLGKYEIWKVGKKLISSALSRQKLKEMVEDLLGCSERMVEYLSKRTEAEPNINMRDVSVRFAIDVTCRIFFGLDAECFVNENSRFKLLVEKLFDYRVFSNGFNTAMVFISAQIARTFDLGFVHRDVGKYLVITLEDELKRRKEKKNDYLQMLKDAAEVFDGTANLMGGIVEAFIAGYEPMSSTLSFAFYELAANEDVQQKLRDEIRCNGTLSHYDELSKLPYLNCFVKESLRKYPLLPFLDRVCTKTCTIDNPDLTIEEGVSVYVPLLGLHYDPEFYPEPHEFRPERFMGRTDWSAYYPFGNGPRMCPARKYAELVFKICVMNVISEFSLKLSSKSPERMRFNTKGFSLQPSGDVFLYLESLNI